MKKLSYLLGSFRNYKLFGSYGLSIKDITDDSRKVEECSLFVAIKGFHIDAHDFIPQAISSGAAAIIGERPPQRSWLRKITYIKTPSSREALSLIASAWYSHPAKKLKMIGVTGTDGKTTTANLIYWILHKSGKKAGLVSTLGAKIVRKQYDTGFHVTSPEPLALQKFLALMVKKGCEYAVLEVTSHGLDQKRFAEIDFDIGVLTNITHEHLDYHKTYTNYVMAKARLFKKAKTAILNEQDKSFSLIKKHLPKDRKVIGYSPKNLRGQFLAAIKTRFSNQNYNFSNACAALAVCRLLGLKEKLIVEAAKSFPKLPGRMEEIKNKKGIRIIVDFAHTPSALENVLKVLKEKTDGRLIAVFGCAGERDVAKRPMMGKISAKLANISIFTAEDPRGEDVNKIIDQIVEGAKKVRGARFYKTPERGEAIYFAIRKLARKGDTVVVCGKGHEESMAYGDKEYPWSDKEAARMVLKGRLAKIYF